MENATKNSGLMKFLIILGVLVVFILFVLVIDKIFPLVADSTRLPEKALLPLGGKTVLEWVLQSMKKVKADRYFLAVDHESKEELELFTMYSKGKRIYEIAQEVESSRAIVSKRLLSLLSSLVTHLISFL